MPDQLLYKSLDFQKVNQIKNAIIHQLADAPGTPAEGQFYYDTDLKKIGVYNGDAWDYMGEGAITSVAGSDSIDIDVTDPENPIISVIYADVFDNIVDDEATENSSTWSSEKIDAFVGASVAAAINGADWKASVRIATNTAIANMSQITVADFDGEGQGITLVEGNRVMLAAGGSLNGIAAVTAANAGIFVVGAVVGGVAALTRSTDANTSAKVTNGMVTEIAAGDFAGYNARLVTQDPITLNTTVLDFDLLPSNIIAQADDITLTVVNGTISRKAHIADFDSSFFTANVLTISAAEHGLTANGNLDVRVMDNSTPAKDVTAGVAIAVSSAGVVTIGANPTLSGKVMIKSNG